MKRAIQVDIQRVKNENSKVTMRRFSRQTKELKLVRTTRARRYYIRSKSKNVERQHALSALERRNKFHELVKLGKIDLSSISHRRR